MPAEGLARMRPQVYRDPRPPEYFERFHTHARTHDPDWVYTLIRVLSEKYCRTAYKLRVEGLDNVPPGGAGGGIILAPNHFSALDHWFVGLPLSRRVRFMAKSQLFRGPLEFILPHGGAFPVRRGARDAEAMTTARLLLAQGGALVMYPEGGRSRSGRMAAGARPGIGRLMLETGAPALPVAILGSERARNWRRLEFPQVTVRYGAPVTVPREPRPDDPRAQAVADAVFSALRTLHDAPAPDH